MTPALSKLSADGQTLMYSTFLGSQALGVGHDSHNQAFALGQNGIAYIGGFTQTADFPTTAGSFKPACTLYENDASYCNTNQAFVAGIDTTKIGAASLIYSSYLGGDEQQTSNIPEQQVYGLAADANNNLFVTGYTSANDFPSTVGVYQPHCNDVNATGNCSQTAFLSKINPTGSALTWSTFLGDTRDDGPGGYGASIAFDAKGQVYLYGLSDDGSGSFPQVDPISTYTSGNKVFIATFSADATKLLFSTRFSGPSNSAISLAPSANGLAVDAAGSMYIVGYTGDAGNFGATTGTYSTTATSSFNRPFFAKISRVNGAEYDDTHNFTFACGGGPDDYVFGICGGRRIDHGDPFRDRDGHGKRRFADADGAGDDHARWNGKWVVQHKHPGPGDLQHPGGVQRRLELRTQPKHGADFYGYGWLDAEPAAESGGGAGEPGGLDDRWGRNADSGYGDVRFGDQSAHGELRLRRRHE